MAHAGRKIEREEEEEGELFLGLVALPRQADWLAVAGFNNEKEPSTRMEGDKEEAH